MRITINKALLLSALAFQINNMCSFASDSDEMPTIDSVSTVTANQLLNYPSTHMREATIRAIATAIGIPNADTTAVTAAGGTLTHSAPLSAIVKEINTNIGTGTDSDTNTTVLGRLGMPVADETGADLKKITVFSQLNDIDGDVDSIKTSIGTSADNASPPTTLFGELKALSSSLQSTYASSVTLTRSADNLMSYVFNYDFLAGAVNFSGTASSNTPALFSGYYMPADSTLTPSRGSTPSMIGASTVDYKGNGSGGGEVKGELQGSILNEYTILAGTPVAGLFNQSSAYFPPSAQLTSGSNINPNSNSFAMLTPAEKLSIFLRAIFGISDSVYQGWFTANPIAQEDAGTVLTTIFDYVLGTNRDGTNAVVSPAIVASPVTGNKFGGPSTGTPASIFNRINAPASTGTPTLKRYGSSIPEHNSALTTPSAYFNFVLGTGKTDPKYDILRVRALIQDLIFPVTTN